MKVGMLVADLPDKTRSNSVRQNWHDISEAGPGLLSLMKSFTDDPVAPGGTVTLEFTLSNLDPSNAASAIAFTDDIDATLPGLMAAGLPMAACGGTLCIGQIVDGTVALD